MLVRETGWEGAGWRGVLESVQVASGGLLRRGYTSLRARDSWGHNVEALTVRVFTRGLEAFAGGDAETSTEGEDAPPAEGAAGGLALSVGGARMRDVTLFNGQVIFLYIFFKSSQVIFNKLKSIQKISIVLFIAIRVHKWYALNTT